MTRKTILSLAIILVMLVSIFGSAGAQAVDDPVVPDDEITEEGDGAKFYEHPIVKLLSAYFDQEDEGEPGDEEGDPDEGDPEEGDPDDEDSGLGPIGEQIADLHADGMGFGVLVKLFAMAEMAEEACAAQEPVDPVEGDGEGEPVEGEGDDVYDPCEVTVETLIEEFEGGKGLGLLFKEHGKPDKLGVGHIKQELKEKDKYDDVDDDGTEIEEKGGRPDKEDKDNGNKLPKEKKPKNPNKP